MKKIINILFGLTVLTGCNEQVVNIPIIDDLIKIDSTGAPLADQTVAWSNAPGASEANFNRWRCVRQTSTGLTWEVKISFEEIPDGAGTLGSTVQYLPTDLQGANHLYTWFDPNPATNGGERGVGDLGERMGSLQDNTYGGIVRTSEPGSDQCLDRARCDTLKYTEDINAIALCGKSNWRVPNIDELSGLVFGIENVNGLIVDTAPEGAANINPDFFPNIEKVTVNPGWFSSTTNDALNEGNEVRSIFFGGGFKNDIAKRGRFHLMLVSDTD